MESPRCLPANIKLLKSYKFVTEGKAPHNEYLCDDLTRLDNKNPYSCTRIDIDVPFTGQRKTLMHPVILGGLHGSAQAYLHRETWLGRYVRPRGYDFFSVDYTGKTWQGVRKSMSKSIYDKFRWVAPFQILNVNGKNSDYPGPGETRSFNDFIFPLNSENDRKIILKTLYDPVDLNKLSMKFFYREKTKDSKKILDLKFDGGQWQGVDWTNFDAEVDKKTLESIETKTVIRQALPKQK